MHRDCVSEYAKNISTTPALWMHIIGPGGLNDIFYKIITNKEKYLISQDRISLFSKCMGKIFESFQLILIIREKALH